MRRVAKALADLTSIRRHVAAALGRAIRTKCGPKGGFGVAEPEMVAAVAKHNDCGIRAIESAFRHCSLALGDIEVKATSHQPHDHRPTEVVVRLHTRGRRQQPISVPVDVLFDAGLRRAWIEGMAESERDREDLRARMDLQSYVRLHARFSNPQARADKAALERHRDAERAKLGCRVLVPPGTRKK